MHWFNIRKRQTEKDEEQDALEQPREPETSTPPPGARTLPPHMQRIVEERARPARKRSASEQRAAFERKRMAIEFDIAQGELASEEENPWSHRIELLTEALETVQQDLDALREAPKAPYVPVPPTPITGIEIDRGDAIGVGFTIADHPFRYEEVLDWAERGHQVALPEFRVVESHVDAIIPDSVPADLREPLQRHLTDSLAVFATDLRDRVLDNEALPDHPTLADLARECPACGGWADWRGRCDACTTRKGKQQALRMEQQRLLKERSDEAEERHRLAERLPLARLRLRDLEAEIAAFERQHGV